jgi:predicted transcriptional regulator of viral defense system
MPLNKFENFITQLQAEGRLTFTYKEILQVFQSDATSLHMGLKRLMDKDRVVRIRNGFYVIIPAEYSRQGILPVYLFIHDLMQWLKKPYYVGLLSAAALQGAGHQQPQIVQVLVDEPPMRTIQTKGLIIRFIVKKAFPQHGLIQKKTDTGYMRISNPVMTALDLLQFERQSGGFHHVLTVLEELAGSFNLEDLTDSIENDWPSAVLQRFGYLCDQHLNQIDLTPVLKKKLASEKIYPVPLSPGFPSKAGKINKNWSVIQNIHPESDL